MGHEWAVALAFRHDIDECHRSPSEISQGFFLEHVPEHGQLEICSRVDQRLGSLSPLDVEQDPAEGDAQADDRNKSREMPEGQAVEGVRRTDGELGYLNLGDMCLPHKRNAFLVDHGNRVEQVDDDLAEGIDDCWKICVATTTETASKVPSPHLRDVQVEMKEPHPLKLVSQDHEDCVQQLELLVVILAPKQHSQLIAYGRGVQAVAPRMVEAEVPSFLQQGET
mmetsp:Transcript_70512/g.147631  ORF Transcript_70512/g.147631 Transcript_70512/m.147631 type:complete len:224 (-) Transcript_70512:910-1581(-)